MRVCIFVLVVLFSCLTLALAQQTESDGPVATGAEESSGGSGPGVEAGTEESEPRPGDGSSDAAAEPVVDEKDEEPHLGLGSTEGTQTQPARLEQTSEREKPRGQAKDESTISAKPALGTWLGLEATAGLHLRLAGGEIGEVAEPADFIAGAGLWGTLGDNLAAGVSFVRTGLGRVYFPPEAGSLTAYYDMNTVWLGARVFPWLDGRMSPFMSLMGGLSWQEVHATGTGYNELGVPMGSYACATSHGPELALGAGIGLNVRVASHVDFVALVEGSAHQLSSDYIERCAPGAGSVTGLGSRVGFVYRFDLEGNE